MSLFDCAADRRALLRSFVWGAIAVAGCWSSAQAQTQLLSGHAFLKGQHTEVGVRPNGAFGSRVVPAGFHPTSSPCLGFIVSRNKNGWGAGSQVDGDFFCPGDPFESWGLSVGGVFASNNDVDSGITGSLSGLVAGPPTHSVQWASAAPFRGIQVQQVYSVEDAGQALRVNVSLTNITGAPINNIRYIRAFDPDNASNPAEVFLTTNTVVGQANAALVTSRWSNGALVALSAKDARATVGSSTGGNWFSSPDDILSGSAAWVTAVGGVVIGDDATAVIFDIGTLAAGTSTSFSLSYLLTEEAVVADTGTGTLAGNLACAADQLNSTPASQFTNPASKTLMVNMLRTATGYAAANAYPSLVLSLLDALIARTDGCSVNGVPDGAASGGFGSDFVTACPAQAPLLICLKEARRLMTSPAPR